MLDYIDAKPELENFYGHKPTLESFEKMIADRRKHPVDRKVLVEELKKQYKDLPDSLAMQNIELLADENTFTICTGHQICIFSGPLYSIYKIATAIATAKELSKKFTSCKFIPVFWMATEDHDYKEINHIHFRGEKLEWAVETEGMVGELPVAGLQDIIEKLESALIHTSFGPQLMELIRSSYRKDRTLTGATRYFVDNLFSAHGLISIDASTHGLKMLFREEMKRELLHREAMNVVGESAAKLGSDYKVQVNPRPINLFYHKDGKRSRIDFAKGSYQILEPASTTMGEVQILDELENHPERFSPNVIMRPLYQEKILPNIAYVGGGGELAYWLELKDFFKHHSVSFPILLLRNSFVLLSESSDRLLKKLELEDEEIFKGEDEIVTAILKQYSGSWSIERYHELLADLFEVIKTDISAVDKTLSKSAEAEHQRCLKRIEHLNKKVNRALKKNNSVVEERIKKLREDVFPNNTFQERHQNICEYYADYGPALIEMIIENIKPFDKSLCILRPWLS